MFYLNNAQELDLCLNAFVNHFEAQTPQVGLQVLKLAMLNLLKEGFAVSTGTSFQGGSGSQCFEFTKPLENAYERVRVRVELSLDPPSRDIQQSDLVSSPSTILGGGKGSFPYSSVQGSVSETLLHSPLQYSDAFSTSFASAALALTSSDVSQQLASYLHATGFGNVANGHEPPLGLDQNNYSASARTLGMMSYPNSFSNLAPSTPSAFDMRSTKSNTEVYVDGLPFEATHDDILNLFSQVGEVLSITSVKSGCAFILYSTPEAAERAITEFNLKLMPGYEKIRKPMRVSESRRQEDLSALIGRHLHVMNVPPRATRADLMSFFSKCGRIASIRLPPARNSTCCNKGYGFVTYEDHESCLLAMKTLSGQKLPGFEAEIKPVLLEYARGCRPT